MELKIKSKYITILLILLVLAVNVYVRTIPARLPITDDWAKNNVRMYYKNEIMTQVISEYPDAPQSARNDIVERQLDELYESNPALILEQEVGLSNQMKDRFRDETGQTYLIAIDPYYYLRHVNHYIENGQAGTVWTDDIGDKSAIEVMWPFDFDNKNLDWDGQRMAPIGAASGMTLHSYFGAYLHKLILIFNKDQTTMATMFYLPVILISLAIIPTFLISKKLAGNLGGFIASMLFVLNANLLTRTVGGFSDTDSYAVLFPLLAIWAFLESITAESTKKRALWGTLAGVFIGLFAFAWVGWWYVFDFVLLGVGLYSIVLIIKYLKDKKPIVGLLKEPSIRNFGLSTITFILAAAVSVSVFGTYHFKSFLEFFKGPFSFIKYKSVAVSSLWPTVRTTVAELSSGTLQMVVNTVGGKVFFIMAILGIILLVVLKNKDKTSNLKSVLLVATWMAGTAWACLTGVRFLILAVPPFAIAIGVFVGLVYKITADFVSKRFKLGKVPHILLFIVACVLVLQPMTASINTIKGQVPSMNDAWYGTLTKIKTESAPDAIITSWWDFGHWFITIADRRVTFDGGGQDETMAYWVGRTLLSTDEKKSAGILRMINCGSNNAFRVMWRENNDTINNIDLLNEIVLLNKDDARSKLLTQFNEDVVDEILVYTHCEPPESYLITSEDMVLKGGVWGHFGSWDFERASMYMGAKKMEQDAGTMWLMMKYGLDKEQANTYYNEIQNSDADKWIADWPSYVYVYGNCQETETKLICTNPAYEGFKITMNKENMSISNEIHSVVFPTEEGLGAVYSERPLSPFSMLLIPKEEGTKNILTQSPQSQSLFTQLFFYRGHTSECFELFDSRKQIDGMEILVWKVNWGCLDE